MYKAAVRFLIRRTIEALHQGDYGPSISRPTGAGPRSFLRQYVDHGIQMAVDDVLVNGPRWNTRIAARVHDWIDTPSGERVYASRAVLFARAPRGRLVEPEDYEDTARVIEYEALVDARGGGVLSR